MLKIKSTTDRLVKSNIVNILEKISPLAETLSRVGDLEEKTSILRAFLKEEGDFYSEEEWLKLCLRVIRQERILEESDLKKLLPVLLEIESFYASIGGIVGYHLAALKLIGKLKEPSHTSYKRPSGYDFSAPSKELNKAIFAGILATADIGEIYLVGGLGDRLKLKTERGDPLPAATLPFRGKSLLEMLVRDLSGREYLYYKLFSKQIQAPIALMTSLELENEAHIQKLLEEKKWFDRPRESIFVFRQILVPVITEEGDWVVGKNGELVLHPGGHGALWKAAQDRGVFAWFEKLKKKAFFIRQINNPLAGIDYGLIALSGIGLLEKKTLGFASCERVVNAAEGVLVDAKKGPHKHATINIEYTDFQNNGIEDRPDKNGYSLYPANTNILFAHLKRIEKVVAKHPLPEFLLNMKNKVVVHGRELFCGRLESMVQNISHFLTWKEKEGPVFVTYNKREKTISTAKREFEEGKTLLETPQGAFYDLLKTGYDLLAQQCGVILAPFSSPEKYLKRGPSLLFLYHPALGPLYDVISQKILAGKIGDNSELELEISELLLDNLHLQGSLLIETAHPHLALGGRCFLKDVTVFNQGIDRESANEYWKCQIRRHEKLKIILSDNAEFFASGIIFRGDRTIVVPPNKRWTAYEKNGAIVFEEEDIDEPTLWHYRLQDDSITLETTAFTAVPS